MSKIKEEAIKGIIDNTIENKPANIKPLVEKIMASKIKDIIVRKQKEISENL